MKNKVFLWTAVGCFALFLATLLCILLIDVQAVGPQGSKIGLASINVSVFAFFGVSELWDKLTDILAAVAILSAVAMAGLGVYQLVKRKSLKKVDSDLLWLCGFAIALIAAYALFELLKINYRPILTEDGLEASFPSTHTIFSVFVMGAAAYECNKRLPSFRWQVVGVAVCVLVAAVTCLGRLLAGLHWLTDVLGGAFFGGGILCLYLYFANKTTVTATQETTEETLTEAETETPQA